MKSKHLGVLLAALALSLSAVSTASAAEFKGSTSPITFTGAQSVTNRLTIQGSSMSCTTATFASAATAVPTNTVLLTPVLKGCTQFGIAGGKFSMNGCQFRFNTLPASFDLTCATGKMVLEVTSALGGCKVEFPGSNLGQNQGLGSVSYANSPTGKVTLGMNITGMTAEIVQSTGFCPLSKGIVKNASYTGEVLLEGNGGASSIEVS